MGHHRDRPGPPRPAPRHRGDAVRAAPVPVAVRGGADGGRGGDHPGESCVVCVCYAECLACGEGPLLRRDYRPYEPMSLSVLPTCMCGGGGQDYDEAEAVARLERIKRAREPDEDGFVVVKTKNKVRGCSSFDSLLCCHWSSSWHDVLRASLLTIFISAPLHHDHVTLWTQARRIDEKRGTGAPRATDTKHKKKKGQAKELKNFYRFQVIFLIRFFPSFDGMLLIIMVTALTNP